MKPRKFTFTFLQLQTELLYDADTGLFTWLNTKSGRTCKHPGSLTAQGYFVIFLFGHAWQAHRLAWFYHYGVEPTERLDHINGNKQDNRICNLRLATSQQNAQNKCVSKANKLGVKGVTDSRGKFKVHCSINGKHTYLGTFETLEAAKACYELAAKAHNGAFART